MFSNTQSNFKRLFRFGILALAVLTIVILRQASASKQEMIAAAVSDKDLSTAERQTATVPMTNEQARTAYEKLLPGTFSLFHFFTLLSLFTQLFS